MTSTDTSSTPPQGAALAEMRLTELKSLAQQMGLKGLSGKRKSELVALIDGARGGRPAPSEPASLRGGAQNADVSAGGAGRSDDAAERADKPARDDRDSTSGGRGDGDGGQGGDNRAGRDQGARRPRGGQSRDGQDPGTQDRDQNKRGDQRDHGEHHNRGQDARGGENAPRGDKQHNRDKNNQGGDRQQNRDQQNQGGDRQQNRDQQNRHQNNQGGDNGPRGDRQQNRDDDGGGRGGRRSRRRRERNRGGNRQHDGEQEVREDDVLQPVAGILDVLDNYAFVRTSGYLAGANDVYVSMNMIRRHGLRRGDAITGAVRMPRDGQDGGGGGGGGGKNRQKFNPLARLDTVNGGPVDETRNRPDFGKLTPLYPNKRLRLETEKNIISTRVIDLIMPIGKGQRALIVSPPKAGKTTVLQNIANAIAVNNPECHLMVVLVDERPEEVTDMQRSVKGEVLASTFDRPPSDHTQVAELGIERAKRLVEMGQDVVVLLDSITRLGRAYNNSSPASGRILSGGVDSTALYPPKKFLGAARNIENGGSLTIIATAMVETGSAGDTVIFEEFKGTGNAELKLDRRIAERRVFPAVDVGPSGTRKEELLMSPEEAGIMHKLRRVLSGLDSHQAIDLLMSQLRKTTTNYEFLLQVAKTTPTLPRDDE